jgi:hypothetical protein
MAYLFKIRYSKTGGFANLQSEIKDSPPIAKILCNALKSLVVKESEKKDDNYDFYIAYHNISDFFGDNGLKRRHLFAQYIYISENKLRDFLIDQNKKRINRYLTDEDVYIDLITGEEKKVYDPKAFPPLPMIHITALDLFYNGETENRKKKLQTQGIIIPRYIKYLDSSIWNQYVPFEKENSNTFYNRLCNAIENIIRYTDEGFYKDDKIKAIADFNARLLVNSHLESNTDKHDAYVAPFIFHSETEMKDKANEQLKKIIKIYGNNLIWRILLVDDKAERTTITDANKETKKGDNINIYEVLNKLTEELQLTKELKLSVEWECEKTLDEAQKRFNEQRFDIILLDYLLDYRETGALKDREYGYELLEKIHEKFDKKKNSILQDNSKGIFDKFWIMFTSVFRNAVRGKLQEKGYTYNTDNWIIARGACPSTTPELFKYNLLSLMLLQLDTITNLSLSKNAQDKIKNKRIITVSDLLRQIYSLNIRENAMTFFDALLKMRANYNILKNDYNYNGDNGSLLVKNLFTDINNYHNAFWEHLQHLVYLTAFGTILQWTDMWAEYMLVKDKLDSDIAGNIGDYIISLNK